METYEGRLLKSLLRFILRQFSSLEMSEKLLWTFIPFISNCLKGKKNLWIEKKLSNHLEFEYLTCYSSRIVVFHNEKVFNEKILVSICSFEMCRECYWQIQSSFESAQWDSVCQLESILYKLYPARWQSISRDDIIWQYRTGLGSNFSGKLIKCVTFLFSAACL